MKTMNTIMKKCMLKRKLVVILIGICGWYMYQNKQQILLPDIALKNIDTLAEGEDAGKRYQCYGTGSVNCPINGTSVQYVYGPYME